MRKTLILTAAAMVLGGLSFVAPASAAVSGPAQGVQAPSAVEHVRMTRRHRTMRRSAAKGSNAGHPSRRPAARQYGGTSGGPRR